MRTKLSDITMAVLLSEIQPNSKVVKKEKPKEKRRFSSTPDPNSKRSKRRKNRGFQSLAQSSRKHRRAASRMLFVGTNTHQVKQKGKMDFHS